MTTLDVLGSRYLAPAVLKVHPTCMEVVSIMLSAAWPEPLLEAEDSTQRKGFCVHMAANWVGVADVSSHDFALPMLYPSLSRCLAQGSSETKPGLK